MRAWALCLVLLAGGLPPSAHAFVFVVDDTADTVDADPDDGICADAGGACTLRAAIQQANAWPGHDFIVLGAGTYTFTLEGRGENGAATGDLDITDDLTIRGAGAGETIIDGASIDRVFDVRGIETRVELQGLTIQGGLARTNPGPAGDNGVGGGVRSEGVLTVRDAAITGNVASPVGGIAGGGLYHTASGDDVTLTLERVEVTGNSADNTAVTGESFPVSGGGIAIVGGAARIALSNVSGNVAASLGGASGTPNGADGGGIQINGGNLVITDSTISGNSAELRGGGISNFSGGGSPLSAGALLRIERSTISGNQAYWGGGIFDDGAPSRTMTIVNSTVSGNTAVSPPGFSNAAGGGLYLSKPAELINVTIAENEAELGGNLYIDPFGTGGPGGVQGSAILGNTVLAAPAGGGNCDGATGNVSTSGPTIVFPDCGLQGNIIVANPGLGNLLTGQGGPTAVHQPGATAQGAGSNALCTEEVLGSATDQRGFPRPAGNCDIGAVEAGGGTDIALRGLAFPNPARVGETLSYVLEIANHGPGGATGAGANLPLPAPLGGNQGCAIGGIGAGGVDTCVIEVEPDEVGLFPVTATASANEGDPAAGNNSFAIAAATYDVTDLAIVTSASTTGIIVRDDGSEVEGGDIGAGDTIIAGQRFTIALAIENTGALARTVRVYSTLSEGLRPRGVTATQGSCVVRTARDVMCTLGDVPEGANDDMIRIDVVADARGTVTHRAFANFDGTFADDAPEDEFTVEVDTRADLSVRMLGSAAAVSAGADLGYTVTVANDGPSDATDPVVTLALDDSVEFRSATAGGWNCAESSGDVTCTRASLGAGDESVLVFFTRPAVPGGISATATVTGDDTDPDPDNNSATVVTTVVDGSVTPADLAIAIAATPNPGIAQQNLAFNVTVSNNGSLSADDVNVTLTLPGGVAFQSATSGCVREGDFVRCALGTIIAGTSATATIVVRPNGPGDISSTAVATAASGQEENLDDNTASITVSVVEGQAGGLSGGGRCFIATAAFGSHLDPHVMTLRDFRDRYLLTHPAGRAFVDWYYRTSPPLAAWIAEREGARTAVRWALTPIVYAVAYPAPAGGLALLALLLVVRARGRRAIP